MTYVHKKITAFLAVNLLLCSSVFASDMQDDEATRGKCKKFQSLTVCDSVTARSFITPSGPLFNGLRNYAVLTNEAEVLNSDNVLWAATPAGNLSSGITFNNATGNITLPTSGIFLVQYSVRFEITPDDSTDAAEAQLYQGGNIISQSAINNTFVQYGDNDLTVTPELTGYALLTTTSSANNVINLRIIFSSSNATLPSTSNPNANAQMVILQLN